MIVALPVLRQSRVCFDANEVPVISLLPTLPYPPIFSCKGQGPLINRLKQKHGRPIIGIIVKNRLVDMRCTPEVCDPSMRSVVPIRDGMNRLVLIFHVRHINEA